MPTVTPPVPPDQSRLNPKKCDSSSLKGQELVSYVVALAQKLLEEHYSDNRHQFESAVVAKLKSLATELTEAEDESEEEDVLKKIRRALITEEEGVSNYEVLMSGIIRAMLHYLIEGEQKERLRRIYLFARLFDRTIEIEKQHDTLDNHGEKIDDDDNDEEGFKIQKRYLSIF